MGAKLTSVPDPTLHPGEGFLSVSVSSAGGATPPAWGRFLTPGEVFCVIGISPGGVGRPTSRDRVCGPLLLC